MSDTNTNLVESVDTSQAEATPLEGQEQSQSQSSEAQTSASPTWYYAENLPGQGDKPEWLVDKFKTASDQAKAYTELEKKLGAFKGAPDEYSLELDDPELKGITFDKANPVLQEFLSTAKEQGVSQEFVNTMLKSYAKMQKMQQPDLDKEIERLGTNAKQDLQILAQWASNNFTKDELPIFKSMFTKAEHVRIFDKIRRMMSKAETQPSTNTRGQYESAESIKRLIHDPRYDSDEVFRNEVRQKLAQVLPE